MSMGIRGSNVAVLIASLGLLGAAANAETHVVELGTGGFDAYFPADLTVNVGDTVQWLWVQGFHNVVSGIDGKVDGAFSSGEALRKDGLTFEVTFDQAFLDANPVRDNVYSYYCDVHFFFGMTGTVTVKTTPPCPADLNDNGIVNGVDLAILLGDWTGATPYRPCPPIAAADLNGDCTINGFDLAILLAAWGNCP